LSDTSATSATDEATASNETVATMMATPSVVDAKPDLSLILVSLLKGVLMRDPHPTLWSALLQLQSQVRDYVAVLALELVLDEAEGYAFLRSRANLEEENDDGIPRLVARRPLSFPVSLILALLRKKLAEFDASGAETRLVLSRDEIVELVRIFLPLRSNETRLFDQIETHLNKIAELGFLRRLKTSTPTSQGNYEVQRILKAFVDAQWLSEFDERLAAYQVRLAAAGDQGDRKLNQQSINLDEAVRGKGKRNANSAAVQKKPSRDTKR
jgi:hypothetical protein